MYSLSDCLFDVAAFSVSKTLADSFNSVTLNSSF